MRFSNHKMFSPRSLAARLTGACSQSLLALALVLFSTARGATVTGDAADTFGGTVRITSLQWTPLQSPVVYNGTNYFSFPVSVPVVNGYFSTNFSGCGVYNVSVRPANSYVPDVLAAVPCDGGSYTFEQCLALATNGFFLSNAPPFTIQGGTNVTVVYTNGVWTVSSTGGSGGGGASNTNILWGTNSTPYAGASTAWVWFYLPTNAVWSGTNVPYMEVFTN